MYPPGKEQTGSILRMGGKPWKVIESKYLSITFKLDIPVIFQITLDES